MNSFLKIFFCLIILVFFASSDYLSAETKHDEADNHSSKKFEPGKFLFDHIKDAHSWHICTINKHHISIPLPVILISEATGFHYFISSHIEHKNSVYEGFKISTNGDNAGKIIEVLEDGTPVMHDKNEVLPLDLSITKNVLAIFMCLTFMMVIFIRSANKYKKGLDTPPKGAQNVVEIFVIFVKDSIALPAIGEKKHERFTPFLLTVFFFILLNNLFGLIPIFPGGANITGNITVTFVLALFTFITITINGNKSYWIHMIWPPGVPWWLKFPIPLLPVVEIVGMFIKPIVLMIRLFANITAGHLIALSFFALIFIFGEMSQTAGYGISVVSIVFTIFMNMLEFLVAFIQAYVFTLLSAIYFGMATEEAHH